MPPPPMSRDIFYANTTSQGGVGFVTAVHTEERKIDVNYNENAIGITNSSPFIDEARLHPHVYAPSDDTGTRSGRHRGAALVSGRRQAAVVTPPPPPRAVRSRKRERNEPKNIYETLAASTSWVSSTGPHPVLQTVKEQRRTRNKDGFDGTRHHHPEPLNDVDLRDEFLKLSVRQQIPYGHGAEALRIRVATASDDIKALSSQLAWDYVSIACPNTVRKYVMALPDSEYESTRMQPLLNSQHRMRRFKWARMFHVIWHGGKMVAEKVQVVTLQSDEKWFFCLVRRRFVKSVPHFGCSPVDHKVHHKKHIDKFMVFGMTAFVPIENNWMRGGEAFKVILQRIGRMVEAKANSHGRVYGENGKYTMPRTEANLRCKKGSLYFKNMEIRGSDEGDEKKQEVLRALDALAQQLTHLYPGKKICVNNPAKYRALIAG
ncbi:hypothetical protein FRACYDRAFT_247519 [Fragilariopsis cylindrus CCMP1102]|uniref:Uncharacterized protein n=1 Tax=Fragilariopsis cylindrus CCMP1102 TaxID=635003 RepID=A0A1E7EY10_9STRA|nr:hypothetical protein FRACYDRAFT_247519 [Fragilariopsis cylindrus CCMP1102]|eukprot:OEU10423.1 hypothetical protein FRACYDRAFT_247519 [Fragilariopsis cylindrus CCMP1102]